jgi:hypothetical protein
VKVHPGLVARRALSRRRRAPAAREELAARATRAARGGKAEVLEGQRDFDAALFQEHLEVQVRQRRHLPTPRAAVGRAVRSALRPRCAGAALRARGGGGRAGRAQPTHHVVLHPLPALPPEGRGVSD